MILLSAQPREDKEPEHRVKDLVTFPIRNQARAPRLGWLGTHGRPQTRDVGAGLQAAAKSVQGRGGQVAVFPAPTPYYPEVCSGPHTSEGARLAGRDVDAPSLWGSQFQNPARTAQATQPPILRCGPLLVTYGDRHYWEGNATRWPQPTTMLCPVHHGALPEAPLESLASRSC